MIGEKWGGVVRSEGKVGPWGLQGAGTLRMGFLVDSFSTGSLRRTSSVVVSCYAAFPAFVLPLGGDWCALFLCAVVCWCPEFAGLLKQSLQIRTRGDSSTISRWMLEESACLRLGALLRKLLPISVEFRTAKSVDRLQVDRCMPVFR